MTNREDRVRAKAHALWEEAGRPDGRHEEHWAQAERHIDQELTGEKPKRVRKPSVKSAAAIVAEVAVAKTRKPPRKSAARTDA